MLSSSVSFICGSALFTEQSMKDIGSVLSVLLESKSRNIGLHN